LSHSPREIVIEPSRGWLSLRLSELWEYRELLFFLVWRDIKVRYKQTLLGASWAVLQPLLTMVVFTIFFGNLAGIDSDGLPYPIFSYTALLIWTFFAQGLTQSSQSLVGSANLIRKVYHRLARHDGLLRNLAQRDHHLPTTAYSSRVRRRARDRVVVIGLECRVP